MFYTKCFIQIDSSFLLVFILYLVCMCIGYLSTNFRFVIAGSHLFIVLWCFYLCRQYTHVYIIAM